MKSFLIRVVILDRNYLVFSWEIVFLLLNCWYISWLYCDTCVCVGTDNSFNIQLKIEKFPKV